MWTRDLPCLPQTSSECDDERGQGTQIAATPALATIQLDGDATETKWQAGAVKTGVPAAPALPENQVCEAAQKEMSRSPIRPHHHPLTNFIWYGAGSCPNDCSNGRCNYETGVCFCFRDNRSRVSNRELCRICLAIDSKAQQRMKLSMGRFAPLRTPCGSNL